MSLFKKLQVPYDPIDSFCCQNKACNYEAKSAVELLAHYRKNYKTDQSFSSHCLYSKQCGQFFKSFAGLESHLRRYHPSFFYKSETIGDTTPGEKEFIHEQNGVYSIPIVPHQRNINTLFYLYISDEDEDNHVDTQLQSMGPSFSTNYFGILFLYYYKYIVIN